MPVSHERMRVFRPWSIVVAPFLVWAVVAAAQPADAPAPSASSTADPSSSASREPYPFAQFLKARGQRGAAISPDGRRVAYLDPVTGTQQVWSVEVEGGWPEQLTFLDERVGSVSWSWTDDERLLYSTDVGGNERYQLFLMRSDGSDVRRLTPGDEARTSFGGWSPDGRMIAYRSNARLSSAFDAYVLELETGESRRVHESDGLMSAAGFSPDSRQLLLMRTIGPDVTQVLVHDLDTGDTRPITADTPPARYYYTSWTADGRAILTLTDRGRDLMTLARIDVATGELTLLRDDPWPTEKLEVSADGTRMALVFNRDGYSELRLHELSPDGSTTVAELPAPELPRGVIYGLDFTPDGRRLAIEVRTPRLPGEIHVYDLEERRLYRATRSSMAGVPATALVEPRLVRYASFDGREISAILYVPERPAGQEGPRPCLVYAHGGPTGQSRPRFSALVQYFATRGYVVLAPNVRGSSGYGRTFLNLDNVELREDSVRDLERGVHWLLEQGLVDPDRIAIYGGSYGGYMVLASLTLYPELWAAGVSSVGIANFVTFLEQTGSYRRSHRELEYGSLEHDRELLERISPLHRVDAIRAPLMVIHGANDPRVPIYEAEQIVAALQDRGRTVEFWRHDNEGHGMSNLETRIATYTRVAEFLDEHLGLTTAP